MERREALACFGPTSAGVPWPFDRVRDGQSDFLVDARRSLSEGKHLLAHAPTGLGKTAVALVAALDYGLAADKLVLFLTSRQSHHRIAIETIRRIEARGLRIPTIDLIAKHSMCLQEAAPSHGRAFQEFCDFRVKSRTCSFFTRDNSAVVAAVLQRTLHVQELVRASSACRVCPHRVAMDAAAHSRLVVCDYNYVFSDIRGRFLPRLGRSLEDLILIVDEAHNLPDRIRAHLVGDLSVLDVLRAAKEARSIDGEVAQELVAVAKSLERFVTSLRSERIARKDEFLEVVEEGLRTLGGDAHSYASFVEGVAFAGEDAVRRGVPTHHDAIAREIGGISSVVPGNVAAFFPSYELLEEAHRRLRGIRLPKKILVERPEWSKTQRDGALEALRLARAESGGALLLGVQGGSLSEGVDYQDNLLAAVIVVGLPLSPPSVEGEALRDYYARKFGSAKGYDYAVVYPAINRLMQAAGRAIRSERDRAAIVLLEGRILEPRYARCLPPDFAPSRSEMPASEASRFLSPPAPLTGEPSPRMR